MIRTINLCLAQQMEEEIEVGAKKQSDIAAILGKVIADLRDLSSEEQQKLLETVATFFGLSVPTRGPGQTKSSPTATLPSHQPGGGFSEARDMSPKEFIMQKQPRTDVERVACLAFYLTHYRNMPHFKTLDVSKLNTEAAQSKMSNTAVAVDNATKTGYLAPAVKGAKQISAPGEVFVQALPDREAAKAAMGRLKPRKKSRRATKAK
jgi:hypothetical protein